MISLPSNTAIQISVIPLAAAYEPVVSISTMAYWIVENADKLKCCQVEKKNERC